MSLVVLTTACLKAESYANFDAAGSYIVLNEANVAGDGSAPIPVHLSCRRADGTPIAGLQVQLQVSAASAPTLTPTWATTDAQGAATIDVSPPAVGIYGLTMVVRYGDFTGTVEGAQAALNVYAPGLGRGVPSGTKLNAHVMLLGEGGALRRDYRGTLHFRTTDPTGVVPPDTAMGPAEAGQRTFIGGVVLATPGTQSVVVSDVGTGAVLTTLSYEVVLG